MQILIAAFSFIIIVSFIVFVHEFGHYIVAKWAGVKIDTFSLGFGKEIWGWNDKSGTRWKISSLPMGGYVKMFGDATEASTPVAEITELTPEEKEKAFYFKPLYKKAAIVVAGPLFNFLLTIVILTGFIFTRGILSTEPVIGEVMKDTPAAEAGLQPDDRILTINGDKVEFFSDISRMLLTNLGTPVQLEIDRAGKKIPVTITPKERKDTDQFGEEYKHPIIGIMNKKIQFRNVGFPRALEEAVRATYNLCAMTLRVIGQIIAGERSAKDTIKGPLGMAKLTGHAAEQGLQTSLFIMALISANLGLVNLFPIPMLDGGHLLFYAIEGIQGKPPGKRFQEYSMRVGMAMIAMLMAFAIINDIHTWLLGFVGK
jgi:regulator of sigma E protease